MSEVLEVGSTGQISHLAGHGDSDIAVPSVPVGNQPGYAHGCVCRHVTGIDGSDALYVNAGSQQRCDFVPVDLTAMTAALRPFPVPLTSMRVWDAVQTSLPASPSADDLGISTGTFKSSSPSLRSIDFASSSTVAYARFSFPVPADYIAGQPISLVIKSSMDAISAEQVFIDAEVVRAAAAPGTDICATAQQDMNSLIGQGSNLHSFTITPTNVVVGDILDVRINVNGSDPDTPSGVVATISSVTLYFTTQQ